MDGKISFNDDWSLDQFNDLQDLKVSGNLIVDKLQIDKSQPNAHPSLMNINIPWEINGSENLITFDFDGKSALFNHPIQNKLKGSIQIKNWIKGGKHRIENRQLLGRR